MSKTLDQIHYEQFLINATDAYVKQEGIEPDEETVRRISTSLAEAGAGWARHSFGTTRIGFYKHLLLTAQLVGEEG